MQTSEYPAVRAVATSAYVAVSTLASNIVAFPTMDPNIFDAPYFPDDLNVTSPANASDQLAVGGPAKWYQHKSVTAVTYLLFVYSLISFLVLSWICVVGPREPTDAQRGSDHALHHHQHGADVEAIGSDEE
ncbi:MAG: hypothetical protein M1830_001348 [Pleopsidium flavum]|nr:MAG: hypothetical protein M1830_001348 [Pleopsidium flavum]